MVLIAIQAALILYTDSDADNTDIWTFVTSSDSWKSIGFLITLGSIAAAIGLTGISSGSIFGFKTDFLVMAPAIGGLIGMGVVFTQLAAKMRDELISRVFTGCALPCNAVNIILAVTIGPLAFYYAWTVIEWWRGRDF